METADPTPRGTVQPGRRWVNLLLGSGVVASIISFIYPALRYIIPPPVAESVSRFVVAAKVGDVRLRSVATDNGGVEFGVLANPLIGSVSVKAPAFAWRRAGASDQSLGDFHVIHP